MKKKVLFLLCDACICGGTYVILEHASRMQKMGYDVTIALVFMKMEVFSLLKQPPLFWHPALLSLRFIHIEEAEKEEFDVAIFSLWATLYFYKNVNAKNYIYFVQSIESRFFPKEYTFVRNLVIKTYEMGLPVITEANWIKDFLEKHFHSHVKLARNGVEKNRYQPKGPAIAEKPGDQLRILVEGPIHVSYKNVAKTVELCKKANVGEIWLLTSSHCESYPNVDRVFSRIPVDEVPMIYRSCDVLVKLSYVEGMFGPPLEMFHCGGTAIVYDVTGHDEYIKHNENAIVIQKDDEEGVINALRLLESNRDFLNQLKAGAIKTANEWIDWDTASKKFADAVEAIAPPLTKKQEMALTQTILSKTYECIPTQISHNQHTVTTELTAKLAFNDMFIFCGTIPIYSGHTQITLYFGKCYQQLRINSLKFQSMLNLESSEKEPQYRVTLQDMIQLSNRTLDCYSDESAMVIDIHTPQQSESGKLCFHLQIELNPIAISSVSSPLLTF